MTEPKLTKLELQIMEALWIRCKASREIEEAFPEKRPTSLYPYPDNRLPTGGQESCAPSQEGR